MIGFVKPPLKRALDVMSLTAAGNTRLRGLVFNELRLRRPAGERLRGLEELRFLSHVFSDLDMSKAQILQDLWVTYETRGRRNGFFVEFGATNGLVNSNTWLLETHYGWTGILAEPNPVWHADLEGNRVCAKDHRCVSTTTGDRIEFTAAADPELSTIASFAGNDHFAGVRAAAPTISVPTVTLNDLLLEHGAPRRIDYMSIDTEGSEFEILSGLDFDRYEVGLFSIEHNNTPTEAKVRDFLAGKGYRPKFPEFSQWDGWFVKN